MLIYALRSIIFITCVISRWRPKKPTITYQVWSVNYTVILLVAFKKHLFPLHGLPRSLKIWAKFREDGGIKTLLQFIQTSNRKTVDLSVSVLANCALEKESRVEVTLNYF